MVAAARDNTAAWLRRVAHPRAWPVRWRIAGVSSGLTLAILMVFGGTIGQIATTRIRDDFNNEIRGAVEVLSSELKVVTPLVGEQRVVGPELGTYVLPDDASVRVFNRSGELRAQVNGGRLGRPEQRGTKEENGMRVETEVLS